jgi:hypothetical protein
LPSDVGEPGIQRRVIQHSSTSKENHGKFDAAFICGFLSLGNLGRKLGVLTPLFRFPLAFPIRVR